MERLDDVVGSGCVMVVGQGRTPLKAVSPLYENTVYTVMAGLGPAVTKSAGQARG